MSICGRGWTRGRIRGAASAKVGGRVSTVQEEAGHRRRFGCATRPQGNPRAIRVGDDNRLRSVTLPGIGQIGVHEDTRRLRRMLAKDRAKILFATVTHHGGRWWVSLNIEAAGLHPATSMQARSGDPAAGSASTGAYRRSSSPLRRRHRGHADRRSAESAGRRDPAAATARESVVPQEERIPQPQRCRRPAGPTSRTRRAISGGISCTRSPTSWSRPTTGSSSKT